MSIGVRVPPRLGVDVGGVIMDKHNDGTDTSFFTDNYLATTATPGALEALERLVKHFRPENVFIVSKCGKTTEKKTLDWFEHHNVYARTGLERDAVFFVRKREEKAPVCAKLGVTHFIDDKLEVLSYLVTVPTRILFCPDEREVERFAEHKSRVTIVKTWADVLATFGVTS